MTKQFIFGVEFSPKWFLDKVSKIEYIKIGQVIKGCKFMNVKTGKIEEVMIGQSVSVDMLYEERPVCTDNRYM